MPDSPIQEQEYGFHKNEDEYAETKDEDYHMASSLLY
jgi:hypothetical protein